MIRTVIIDDEPNAIKALSLELEPFTEVEILNTFTDASKAIPYINNNEVDVVFLDMSMPAMSGLQFLQQFKEPEFLVVFCTAYSEFAISAVKNQALDYLLKPVDSEDLEECIDKIKKKIEVGSPEQSISKAIEKLNSLSSGPKKIKIFTDGKIYFIIPDQITYCEADGSYTHIHFIDEEKNMMVSKRLKTVEEWLPSIFFLRVHNSYIVNVKAIAEYYKKENYIVLTNGKVIPISRNRKKDIMDKL